MKRITYKRSRMQRNKECWWCKREDLLEHHEFLNGPDRRLAIDDRLWVWACAYCHRKYQNDDAEMKKGQRKSQEIYEQQIGTRASFMKRYRQNYL